jgi:outer membrane protein TolC
MKQIITIILTCLAGGAAAWAQQPVLPSTDLAGVLQSIAANNNELKMNARQSAIINAQYAAANVLPDPTVSYTRQYGNKEGLGINGELIASQSFDFPLLYAGRNKLAKLKAQSLDLQQAGLRRQILLEAKEICLDLILLRQEQKLLAERLANAEQLEKLYARRLETGDANRIEINKISLELLNVKTEYRRNAVAMDEKQKELETLNGGLPIRFDADDYEPLAALPALGVLCEEALAADAGLKALQTEQAVAGQALKVSRAAGWMPGMEAGYQLNTAARGERFGGFLVGVSIPIFSNRPKVRQAKAEILYAGLKYDDAAVKTKNELTGLYRRALALKESADEYRLLLEGQANLSLLNKALGSGRISMIEYFVEVVSFYDSLRNCMQLENEYRKTLSRLLKHRL